MSPGAWEQLALSCGADKAAVIPGDRVVVHPSFREICEKNSCGQYGKCYMCPPFVGEIGDLMDRVRGFPYGLLYQTISSIEDSFDFEGMQAASRAHVQMSQRLLDAHRGRTKGETLHLASGACGLCESCAARSGEPCRFPDRALPSMESYGIDVYNTTKDTPLKYINGQNTVTHFGIVLYGEEDHG
ncbi:MAG: DUF2284 domain-containing protein [Clostridiales bacterium]|nr:DUF2284 domain-containing protein [Bacillota bacterium]NLL54275.1 DUF2284 domain-containing protein [Clostridiales bacterium]